VLCENNFLQIRNAILFKDFLVYDYSFTYFAALSILQNGKMPVFLNPELVQEVFNEAEPKSSAINYLRQGLNVLGLYDVSILTCYKLLPRTNKNFDF
jgi:hypothetical protein